MVEQGLAHGRSIVSIESSKPKGERARTYDLARHYRPAHRLTTMEPLLVRVGGGGLLSVVLLFAAAAAAGGVVDVHWAKAVLRLSFFSGDLD